MPLSKGSDNGSEAAARLSRESNGPAPHNQYIVRTLFHHITLPLDRMEPYLT